MIKNMRKRVSGIFVSVLVAVFTFCILCTVFDGRKVNADPGMWCSSNPWDIGSDEYEFNFGFWGAQNGDTVNFTITFDASEVFVTERGSVFNVIDKRLRHLRLICIAVCDACKSNDDIFEHRLLFRNFSSYCSTASSSASD